jgi:peptide/nickel transport system permease protein
VDSQRLTLLNRIKDSDIYFSFLKSPTAIVSSVILVIIFFCSFFVELVAPFNPFDPSSLSLMEAFTPPSWSKDGVSKFLLGTDGQGRDMLSTILYGSRISLIVGFSAILFSLLLGVTLGLTAGYFGGKYEMVVMRLTDVQLTVPSILMALLVDGIARGIISKELHNEMAIYVLIFAIGISEWPQFARVSRAATLVEKNKDYVSASTIIGVSNSVIMFKHILPNILRPVLVIGTIGLALAIITESTLSFLGVGLGLTAGYFGGKYEMIVMRLTDVQLTVPSILMALLVDGIARGLISREMHDEMAIYVLIFAIGISEWPQFARVSRAATLVEKNKDYVSASTIIGVSNLIIMFKHILPNILRPILVIGTIGLALAIIAESTLSFLGVGVPPTTPSLGTLIRLGNDFLFSGEWWITFFPAIFLVILAFSINLLGDWMRDTLNPKLNK